MKSVKHGIKKAGKMAAKGAYCVAKDAGHAAVKGTYHVAKDVGGAAVKCTYHVVKDAGSALACGTYHVVKRGLKQELLSDSPSFQIENPPASAPFFVFYNPPLDPPPYSPPPFVNEAEENQARRYYSPS